MGATTSSDLPADPSFNADSFVNGETDLEEVLNIRQAFINCAASPHSPQSIKFKMLKEFPFLSNEDLKSFIETTHISIASIEIESTRE